jgi:hypothetical protein
VNRFISITAAYFIILVASITIAQDIYVYPNKKLADQGQIEYRRYTLEEARAYQQGGSFEPFLTAAWSNEQRITADSNVYGPKTLISGDSIFTTYFTIAPLEPYFISSYEAGDAWNQKRFLGDTTNTYAYEFPELAKYGSDLFIGCSIFSFQHQGYNIGYNKSTNLGISWDTLKLVFPYYRGNQANFTSITNDSNNIFMSYAEIDHDSLYVLKSTDWGVHWNGRGTNVATANTGMIQPMVLRGSGNTLQLVWVADLWPVAVHYSRSTDAGQIWSPEIDITQDPLGAQRCFTSIQDTHIVLSWMGYKYSPYAFTGDIFIRQSYDGGATWDTAQVVTDSHYVWMGSNYVKDSLIVVTWQDDRYRNQNYNSEIYVKYSTDYGVTWSQETRLSFGDDDSDSPIASSTNSIIHILWGDRRPGATGLYYIGNDLHDNIGDEIIPSRYSQLISYPNPFNSSTIIKYPQNEGGEIGIYNLLGQKVKALRISLNGGQVVWNGTDSNNKAVPSGVYFARVKASEIGIGAKLLLLR